jgi:hypothetical protein
MIRSRSARPSAEPCSRARRALSTFRLDESRFKPRIAAISGNAAGRFFDRPRPRGRVRSRAMTIQAAVADTSTKTVTFGGKTYNIQALSDDSYTVLLAGVPVGRVVYSFGAANGVPEGNAMSEDDLYAIAEAWFAAVDA